MEVPASRTQVLCQRDLNSRPGRVSGSGLCLRANAGFSADADGSHLERGPGAMRVHEIASFTDEHGAPGEHGIIVSKSVDSFAAERTPSLDQIRRIIRGSCAHGDVDMAMIPNVCSKKVIADEVERKSLIPWG